MHFTSLLFTTIASLTLTNASALLARGVNDACAPQTLGSGPVPPRTGPGAFQKFGTFSTVSTSATTPSGYQRTFHNQLASTQGSSYMGLYTLSSYDTTACANLCGGSVGCQGFNLYFERDPTLNPAPGCANPPAMTTIGCTLYGAPPTSGNLTNVGQFRQQFQVVIAGSNGYAMIGSVSTTLADYGVNPNN